MPLRAVLLPVWCSPEIAHVEGSGDYHADICKEASNRMQGWESEWGGEVPSSGTIVQVPSSGTIVQVPILSKNHDFGKLPKFLKNQKKRKSPNTEN